MNGWLRRSDSHWSIRRAAMSNAPPGVKPTTYLFMVNGTYAISAADSRYRFPAQAFAVLQESIEFTVENDSSVPASIIKVIAPPQSNGRSTPGFTGKIAATQRAEAPIFDLLDEKKTSIYFVDEELLNRSAATR